MHVEQRQRTHAKFKSAGISHALLANEQSVRWLTGYAPPMQLGTNLFSGGPALIWYEDGGYWRVAALAPSAGGRYAAIDLIRLVQEEMATFDEQQREWQPRLK